MTLRFAVRALPAVFVAALAFACQGQGEGAPCDTANNVSGDCQSGLTCRSVPGVSGFRCCPTGPSNSPDCTGSESLPDANPPPEDATLTTDSGGDATAPESGLGDSAPEAASPEAATMVDAEAGPTPSGSDAAPDSGLESD